MPLDWLLTASERGNRQTRLDESHSDDRAWSSGNHVRPLIHGGTYFAELCERLEATRAGDLVFFNGGGHTGIYIGDGQYIHAPKPGDKVKIGNLSDSWASANYEFGRRFH